ncbi:MAG: KEOPS complex subunit Pcc1 [Candidatus Nezhaarchaeales archaeon]
MSCHQHIAIIEITTKEHHLNKILYLALKPEIEEKTRGFTIEVFFEGEKLIIRFNAKSLSRLRAILNSYLRWIKSIYEIIIR